MANDVSPRCDDETVPTLNDLARSRTNLGDADLEWLHSLVSDWQLLADLSFADLILWAPARDDAGWLAVAQMRPTTGPTSLQDDIVGTFAGPEDQRLLDVARDERRIWRESDPDWTNGVPVRAEGIPVTRAGQVIAVIERCTNLNSARTPSRLELTYLQGADDLARMVAEGTFPFPGEAAMLVRSPRVGDGLLRLGKSGRVSYASPNAQSAYRRLGLAADLIGAELAVITAGLCASDEPLDESLMLVAAGRAPREAEVDGNGSVVHLRAIPLIVGGARTGALILVRDVTELRRRERELMSKDATIREIHHRVKNNLQTVAALLRLQARRLRAPEARAALDEAVRRVGSIAVVHETLSHAPDEIVDFDDIADRVAMMAGEVSAPEVRVTPKITGSFGPLSAAVATPLALVLTELLQNALQHGFPQAATEQGLLEVVAVREPDRLTVTVADNGAGLPAGFDLDSATSLGLQIVRTLVVSELGGRLQVRPKAGGGTEAVVDLPVGHELPQPHPTHTRHQCDRSYVRAGAEPDHAALERAPLIFAHPAPDTGVLPAVDGPA
jgi:two-component system, sensor histidine kinase PdtaS